MIKKISLLALACSSCVHAAIVDVLPNQPLKEEETKSFSADISSQFESGNTEEVEHEVTAFADYQYHQNQLLGLLNYEYEKADKQSSTDQKLAHLRFVDHLKGSFSIEYFTQLQANDTNSLRSRFLMGSGIRQSLFLSKKHWLYIGYGVFYTWEDYQTTQKHLKEHYSRGNFYSGYIYTLNDTTNIIQKNYFQPRYNNASDYYMRNTFQLQVKLSSYSSLYIEALHTYDSKPFANIHKQDYSSKIGFVLNFS